jgi:hypothetical protein
VLHQVGAGSRVNVQGTISDGSSSTKGAEDVAARVDEQRLYTLKFVSVGSLKVVCKEERCHYVDVHRLLEVELSDSREQVSPTKD